MPDYFKFAKGLLYLPVLLMTAIVTRSTLFPFIVGKYVFLRSVVGIALILFLLGLLFQTERGIYYLSRVKALFKKPIFLSVFFFTVAFLLAGFFGIDPLNSFWSNFERGEGGLQILTFFVYFTLLVTLFEKKEEWHRLLGFGIVGGVLMALYGLFAGLNFPSFVGVRFSEEGARFQGSIGNPAYVAVYSLFVIFYCLYFLVQKGNKKFSWREGGLLALIALFLSVFFLAGTRGAFLGLGTAVLAILAYIGFSYKRFRVKTIGLIIVFVALVGTLIAFQNAPLVKKIPGSRVFAISLSAETFQHRMIMWKVAWDGFQERPILGWGPENFIQVFDRHFNTKYFEPEKGFGSWFDRAHSVIFDYLVATGIIGLLAYLSLFVSFYIAFFKRKKSEHEHTFYAIAERALFFALPAAYLVQGLVLFDVSVTYLSLFTVLAFSLYKFSPLSIESQKGGGIKK